MEFKFQTVHLLISLIYHSPVQTYLLNFPNDNQSTYGLFQNDYNFKPINGETSKSEWKGWDIQGSQFEENVAPEERIIKLQVLDDSSHHRRPNSLHYNNYWNDIHRPNRYAPGHEKNQTSTTIHSYHPTPHSDQYHWQKLRPVSAGGQQYTPLDLTTNSLNFKFGDTVRDGTASNLNNLGKPLKYSTPKVYAEKIHPVSATEKSTSTRKHSSDPDKWQPPADDYKRKRVRLEIHPGLIVAPIAGFAAYKAVSAFTTNPVLLELGLLKRRLSETSTPESPIRPTEHPHYHHHHHYYSHPVSTTTDRPHHHGHHHGNYHPHPSTDYPVILGPNDSDRPNRPWWGPFAAIIPRFRMSDIYGMGNERD